MRYTINLQAGVPVKQFFRGRCLALVETGAAGEVGVKVFRTDLQDVEDFGDCGKNFSLFYADGGDFMGAEFVSTVNTVVEVIISRARVETMDGANLTVSLDADQIPLSVETTRGGAPATPFYVTGLTYADTPAATNHNNAAVAVGGAAVVVLAANAVRLEARFTNIGTVAVAIGAAGLTWAQRSIVLEPGDTWVEQKGAALAWTAITAGAAGGSVTVQELRS